MRTHEFITLLKQSQRRYHLLGDENCGLIIALDVEGRIFSLLDGEVISRVNPEAFLGFSDSSGYLNPGGDGFWPAPEGSCLGYEYSTAGWRVPPGLCHARWQVQSQSAQNVCVSAEIDLINAQGLGLPCRFTRDISIAVRPGELQQQVRESIEYLGKETLSASQALLAPWSLCQFDCDEHCYLLLPHCPPEDIWDLYTPASDCHRRETPEGCRVGLKTDFRFQLGLSPKVNWLEFRNPAKQFLVHRTAALLPKNLHYIDIADRDCTTPPSGRPVRFSAYCDPSGFMEIEAAGGTPELLCPNASTSLDITTVCRKLRNR